MRIAWCVLGVSVMGCDGAKTAAPEPVASGASTASASAHAHVSASTHASSTAAAHAKPPAPRSKTTKAPKLPKLAGHEKPKIDPARAPSKEYPCGTADVDGHVVEISCVEPIAPDAGSPSRAILPYSLMPVPREHLPSTVDHRAGDFEGPTRSQGATPACTAFAMAGVLDHALAMWTGKPGEVSVMQIWARYHLPNTGLANANTIGRAIGPEHAWPFDVKTARSWLPQAKCKTGEECGKTPDPEKLSALDKAGIVLVTEVEKLGTDDHDLLRAKLAAGRDVLVAVKVTDALHHPIRHKGEGDDGAMYVADGKTTGGGHAMVLAGYHVHDDGTYFLLKNSWGKKWGENGFAWIHEKTLRKMLTSAYVVDAEPIDAVGAKWLRAPAGTAAACPEGQAPDAITQACTPRCAHGGPTSNGLCADLDGCEPGMVNLIGECLLAAPKASGHDPKSGIAFSCGPGGCVYDIPRGTEGCKDAKCQKSCPAPDFRLAKGKNGLTCVE